MQPTLQQPAKGSAASWFINPLINKLGKITEVSEDSVTYSGVAKKCLGFMISIFVGAALALILQSISPMVIDADGEMVSVSISSMIALIVSGIFFVLTPFLAFFIRVTIPVTGTLYCASTGYIFAFMAHAIPSQSGVIMLAMLLTVMIVAVMALVYSRGWVKVDHKFRTVISVLFWSTVASSVLVGICWFIPALKCIPQFIAESPLINIGVSLVYVIIASLFLLVDFQTIQSAVDRKLPRKYEWYAAFGLAFSVIWLFLKLLSLISKIKDNGK